MGSAATLAMMQALAMGLDDPAAPLDAWGEGTGAAQQQQQQLHVPRPPPQPRDVPRAADAQGLAHSG